MPVSPGTVSIATTRRSRARTRLAALVLVLIGLAGLGGLAWTDRHRIDVYFENRVEAPPTTTMRTPVTEDLDPVVRLAAAGDVGTGDREAYLTAAVMDQLDEERNYDALLLLGDNVYDSGDPEQVEPKVLEPFGPVLDDTSLIPVLGNHDVRDGNGPGQAAALGMPNLWYTRRLGNTLIVALDSNKPDNPEQLAWLESILAGPRPAWTIVTMHHPAFSAGWHGSEPGVQAHFVPLFERYGVDLVLSGHDHDYQRSKEIKGTTYIVSGAAAKLRATGREDFTEVAWSTYSFVDLAVYDDRIEGQAIDHDGRAIDSFTLQH